MAARRRWSRAIWTRLAPGAHPRALRLRHGDLRRQLSREPGRASHQPLCRHDGRSRLAQGFHGEQIGVTTLTMARLQAQILAGPPPHVEPSRIDEAALVRHFGRELGHACWQEFRKKRVDPAPRSSSTTGSPSAGTRSARGSARSSKSPDELARCWSGRRRRPRRKRLAGRRSSTDRRSATRV